MLNICGCKGGVLNTVSNEKKISAVKKKVTECTLLYSESDSLNPYKASTDLNRTVCQLIYSPLFTINEDFSPHNVLCDEYTLDGKIFTVKIKDAFFSDNTPVTLNDILYSYNYAVKASISYRERLSCVTNVEIKSDSIVFTLDRINDFSVNLFTFPILKENTADIADSDSVEIPPIGCGRYYFDEDEKILLQNDNYFGKVGTMQKIRLINAPDEDSISHYVEIGACHMFYAGLNCKTIPRMDGEKKSIVTTDLIYIGINPISTVLDDENVRYAVSLALDRESICTYGFYTNAVATKGFYHPYILDLDKVQTINTTSNVVLSQQRLNEAGYTYNAKSGYFENSAGKVLSLSLLVNSSSSEKENAALQIVSSLKSAGIKVTVVKQKYSKYVESLKDGDFNLYLADTYLYEDFDLSPLLCENGSVAYSVKKSSVDDINKTTESEKGTDNVATIVATNIDSTSLINGYYEGEYTIDDMATLLITEMSVIPIAYKSTQLFYNKDILDLSEATYFDLFYSKEFGY